MEDKRTLYISLYKTKKQSSVRSPWQNRPRLLTFDCIANIQQISYQVKQMNDFDKITAKFKRLQRYMERDMHRKIGIESRKFFTQNFYKQGFVDRYLEKWQPAKRTDSSSVWYGFQYGAKTPPPDNHPRRKGAKKPYKARKPGAITNYSPAATKRKTLIGLTGDLKESLEYRIINKNLVVIESDVPYAKVHNEGGNIKIFGKKTAKVPQRKFLGKSQALENKLKKMIQRDINRILNNK